MATSYFFESGANVNVKANLNKVRIEPATPVVPFDNLFYWVHFSYSFINESEYRFYKEKRRPFGFKCYAPFARPLDPSDASYVSGPEDFDFERKQHRKACCGDILQVGVSPGIDFEVCLFQEVPWLMNLVHSGGICLESVFYKIQAGGFVGLERVQNKNSTNDSDSAKYCAVSPRSFVTQRIANVPKDHENFCPQCGFQPVVCLGCERRRCRDCFSSELDKKDFMKTVGGTDYGPVQLHTWNGDDMVAGELDTLVTGRLLKFMLAQDLSPFGYGPVAVEAMGASEQQLAQAEKAKCAIELRSEMYHFKR